MRNQAGGDGIGGAGVLDADGGGSSAAGSSGSGSGGSDSGSSLFGAGTDGAGNDGDGSGGSGAGTGKRKRGRPRKVTEMVGELPGPTLTDQGSSNRGRKRGPDLSVLVETTVVGLFGLVAVATAHEHWLKDRVDVAPITGPLNAWIDQLPAKTLKRVEKNLAPALLVVGIAVVVGPDIAVEMRERAKLKKPVLTLSGPSGLRSPVQSPADRFEDPSNGAFAAARASGEWSGSIPSVPPIGFDGDV